MNCGKNKISQKFNSRLSLGLNPQSCNWKAGVLPLQQPHCRSRPFGMGLYLWTWQHLGGGGAYIWELKKNSFKHSSLNASPLTWISTANFNGCPEMTYDVIFYKGKSKVSFEKKITILGRLVPNNIFPS